MSDWDFDPIVVVTGEWWLFLGAILIALVSFLLGWIAGAKQKEKELERLGYRLPDDYPGGSTPVL